MIYLAAIKLEWWPPSSESTQVGFARVSTEDQLTARFRHRSRHGADRANWLGTRRKRWLRGCGALSAAQLLFWSGQSALFRANAGSAAVPAASSSTSAALQQIAD